MDFTEKLSAPLDKEDIEWRVGSAQPGYNGLTLLAYKTARTDTKRLNEVCGVYWRNSFRYDTKGLLVCTIEIYDKETKQWIPREDVGTESMTEADKGKYSDSFKRCGVKWGIGIELYNMPNIWIDWDKWTEPKNNNQKPKPKGFKTNKIRIDEYEVVDGAPTKLKLSYSGKVIYNMNAANSSPKNQKKPTQKETKEEEVKEQPKQQQKQPRDINAIMFDISEVLSYFLSKGTDKGHIKNSLHKHLGVYQLQEATDPVALEKYLKYIKSNKCSLGK